MNALYRLIDPVTPANSAERIAIADALNRVTANPVLSPINVPAFANSAMDGYAIRYADLASNAPSVFNLQGISAAGHPYPDPLKPGYAVRIFTGAAIPQGADTVVIQENVQVLGQQIQLRATTDDPLPNANIASGAFVRPIGHDTHRDQPIIPGNHPISPFNLAAATTSGVEQVDVLRKLRIGVFATGDELREPGQPLGPGQIYESNRIAIRSLLAGLPVTVQDLGILPDNAEATQQALLVASKEFDALITSGGVSVGDADFVRHAIEAHGSLDFWRLNLRPGKPFAFGRIGQSLVFGLPGNPVSSIVTLLLLVKPALWHFAGRAMAIEDAAQVYVDVPLAQDLRHETGRHEFQRATLIQIDGKTCIRSTSDQSSNRLQSFTNADCLIRLDGDQETFLTGTTVPTLPFFGLL